MLKRRIYKQTRCAAAVLFTVSALGATGAVQAENIPLSDKLFGLNYWYYNWGANNTSGGATATPMVWSSYASTGSCAVPSPAAGVPNTNDCFEAYKSKAQAAGAQLVRIGGTTQNVRILSTAELTAQLGAGFNAAALSQARKDQVDRYLPVFLLQIDRIKAAGMEPLVQMPINLPAEDRLNWITQVKNKGVKYWSIGNEPDLDSRLSPINGTVSTATCSNSSCSSGGNGLITTTSTVTSNANSFLSQWYEGGTVSPTKTVTVTVKNAAGVVQGTPTTTATAYSNVPITIDGNTYRSFRDNFVDWAKAIKTNASDAVVVGPEFSTAFGYDTTSTSFQPLLSLHRCFISDVGNLRLNGSGVPLLDIYNLHMYASWNESEANRRLGLIQGYIDLVNKGQSNPAAECNSTHQYGTTQGARGSDKLVMAVGEASGTYSSDAVTALTALPTTTPFTLATLPSDAVLSNTTSASGVGYGIKDGAGWHFDAGQFMVVMAKQLAQFGGKYFIAHNVMVGSGTPATSIPSTNLWQKNGTLRSTAEHWKALATNARTHFMAGTAQTTNLDDKLVQFAMTGASGSTVMIMNTTGGTKPGVGAAATVAPAETLRYSARLNGSYSLDAFSSAQTDAVNFAFVDAVGNDKQWKGAVPAKTTHMFTFDATGKRLKKWVYNKADHDLALLNGLIDTDAARALSPGGKATDLTLRADQPAGSSGNITLKVNMPATLAEYRNRFEFLVDGKLVGSTSETNGAAPLTSLTVDSTKLTNGQHTLVIKGYDKDGSADSTDPLTFSTSNRLDVSAKVTFFSTGLVYNRATRTYNGSIKISNAGATTLSSLQLQLNGLPMGVTLQGASGNSNGAPYINISASIAAGAAVTVPLVFDNHGGMTITYKPALYSFN
ncbi:hypothetical protein [Roseateles sp.]|uniref:hypothetical protein n=1 Tax=Roseateles sp. TaxID=1971397 RepID=UPI003BA7AAA8